MNLQIGQRARSVSLGFVDLDREPASGPCRQGHRCSRARRDALFDVVPVQVYRERAIACPAKCHNIALQHTDHSLLDWQDASSDGQVDHSRLSRGGRHGQYDNRSDQPAEREAETQDMLSSYRAQESFNLSLVVVVMQARAHERVEATQGQIEAR
jgi:hypothetical protein